MAKRPRPIKRSSRSAEARKRLWRTGGFVAGALVVGSVLFYAADKFFRTEPPAGEEHHHPPAPHGGLIVPVGEEEDHFHVEALVERGGVFKLYTLGEDAASAREVESQTLMAQVGPKGEAGSTQLLLSPVPQPADTKEHTSLFVGKLPRDLLGKELAVTIPGLTLVGKRFQLDFTTASSTPDNGTEMSLQAEEEKLLLTPGGKYTEADIKANGHVTASQKFHGFQLAPDLSPRPGDKVCPVTREKANPECTWVVSGKVYEFCCPPCVDEFVRTAKERPQEITEPEDYVKK